MTTDIPSGAETYSSAIKDAVGYTHWVVDTFAPYYGRRLMEVGLGHGGYRRMLPPLDFYVGVDIDADSIANARAENPADLYRVADITSPELVASMRPHAIDTVLCANVIEHVPDDRKAIANLLDLLVPGGHLLIFVPAFQALYSDMDRLAGHVRRYRRRMLEELVPPTAGRIVESRYFNSIGGVGWYINGLARHRSLNAGAVNRQIELFDKYVLPVSRLIDPLTRPFFGQSAICVVRKT